MGKIANKYENLPIFTTKKKLKYFQIFYIADVLCNYQHQVMIYESKYDVHIVTTYLLIAKLLTLISVKKVD